MPKKCALTCDTGALRVRISAALAFDSLLTEYAGFYASEAQCQLLGCLNGAWLGSHQVIKCVLAPGGTWHAGNAEWPFLPCCIGW